MCSVSRLLFSDLQMEHYCKGRNEEEELRKDNIPMRDLPSQFSWLEVTGSTRVRTDVGNMSRLLREEGAIGQQVILQEKMFFL